MTRTQPRDAELREHLAAFAAAYLRDARAMSYAELCTRQEPPWASIACGGAGIAATLCHPRRARSGDLAVAERLVAACARGVRDRSALWAHDFPAEDPRSIYYAADGVGLVRLLVASARRKGTLPDRLLRVFLARCRVAKGGPSELLQGAAGYLAGLVILHRRTRDRRALAVADDLARDLLARSRGRRGWARSRRLDFAHGRAGTFHALLGWSLAADRDLPASFFDDLAGLANDWERAGERRGRRQGPDAMQLAWCNGAAGLVLLWARAYERSRDAAHLRLARRASRFLWTHTADAAGDLCCGLGGRAYALLAMDRVEPAHGWYDRALKTAGNAVAVLLEGAGSWPNGLLKGFPGLVCLARDLLRAPAERRGFPLVEG